MLLAERQLLVHHADAGGERVARAREAHLPAVARTAPVVGCVDARENLSERALPGAVLAAERVAGAGGDLERDVVSACTPGKRFVMCSKRTAGARSSTATA